MSWHYAARHTYDAEHDEHLYEVVEVYPAMGENGTDAVTENAMSPMGETVDELARELKMMRDDVLRHPVIEVD